MKIAIVRPVVQQTIVWGDTYVKRGKSLCWSDWLKIQYQKGIVAYYIENALKQAVIISGQYLVNKFRIQTSTSADYLLLLHLSRQRNLHPKLLIVYIRHNLLFFAFVFVFCLLHVLINYVLINCNDQIFLISFKWKSVNLHIRHNF
jgi:hypothetical protein